MKSGEASGLDFRNVRLIDEMRVDSAEEIFEFFKWDFPTDFDCFSGGFLAVFQWIFRAE